MRERYPDRYNGVLTLDVQIPRYAIEKNLPPERIEEESYPLGDTVMDREELLDYAERRDIPHEKTFST